MAYRTTATEPPPTRARVLSRGRRATVTEGAFVGGPFLVLIPVAFCAALLRQARTILELAALTGRNPTERDRAAELLVLQGVYADVPAARAGLAAHTADRPDHPGRPGPPGSTGRRGRAAALWTLTLRMARLLGLLTPTGPGGPPRRSVRAARWLLLAAVIVVGMAAPLVWLPYMADSYDRATTRLNDRAVRFYFPQAGADDDASPPRTRRRPDPAALAGAGRALLSLLVPAALAVGVLASDLRIAGGNWPVLTLVLTAASLGTGAVWLWRRHRRRRPG
ncbi:hypothetical protein J2X68_006512 [Streptomyces sp. 3330]|uniref:hypothetical protein n=1 Tax=Streptomyces sp. 3330 TaxID=2817755 RepID=UPI00285D4BA8|nr:hypothetical protein [Streptomyces sp. 3330]MDR6979775.1 hypothetical protein [Streptomyces sp. 3330]